MSHFDTLWYITWKIIVNNRINISKLIKPIIVNTKGTLSNGNGKKRFGKRSGFNDSRKN